LKKYRTVFGAYPVLFFLILLLLAGCRSADAPSLHIKQDMDFSFIKRIAVLPFKNLTAVNNGDEVVRAYVANELLSSGFVDVVVPGDVASAMSGQGIKDISSMSGSDIQALGRAMKVQAVVFGTVETWQEVQSGSIAVPEITLTVMMADCSSGNIIWSVTWREGGGSFTSRHLGYQTDTMSKVALRAVKNAIRTLGNQ
jgi:hypothetical protein